MFVDGITRSLSPTANIYHGFCSLGGSSVSFAIFRHGPGSGYGRARVRREREDLIDVDTHPPPFGEGTNSINQTLQKRHTCERGTCPCSPACEPFLLLPSFDRFCEKLTKRNRSWRPEAAMPAITIFLYLCKIRKQGSGVGRMCQTGNHWEKSLDSVRNSLPLWGSC